MDIGLSKLEWGTPPLDRIGFGVELTWSPSFGCFRYFDEIAGVDVIDVTVNRYAFCNEWMLANTPHVLNDT